MRFFIDSTSIMVCFLKISLKLKVITQFCLDTSAFRRNSTVNLRDRSVASHHIKVNRRDTSVFKRNSTVKLRHRLVASHHITVNRQDRFVIRRDSIVNRRYRPVPPLHTPVASIHRPIVLHNVSVFGFDILLVMKRWFLDKKVIWQLLQKHSF